MFERNLADLIKGLRATSKQDEPAFIAKAIEEIRNEVKSKDMELKGAAILKLTYLEMMGYDMAWASFNVIEVMSSARAHLKAVGYLAAVQSFKEDTDVLMLTTNTLKKDIASPNPVDIATSLDGLSHIITTDIARDLSLDLIAMLNHSRPRIRKRAVLIMFKVFDKYPEIIPKSMTRLREKLEDSDPGVVSATVNILCELARRNPQDYLPLAPQLFDLLTRSSNNWMLIKLIKLFGALTPHEPRLVKKLFKPISELISTTPAVSLLYECVHTCIIGGMLEGNSTASASLATTCVNKLSAFLSDNDQNLKYIALLALVKIVPTHPHLVAVHQNEILGSLEDQDLSIRMRALDLVSSMSTVENIKSIVQRLLSHLVPPTEDTSSLPSAADALSRVTAPSSTTSPAAKPTNPNQDPAYRRILAERIISICSALASEHYRSPSNSYSYSYGPSGFDYEWYISVLIDLSYVAPASVDTGVGSAIRDQLLDVVMRVSDAGVRKHAAEMMAKLLNDETLLEAVAKQDDQGVEDGVAGKVSKVGGDESDVLWAAAWLCGEFCSEISDYQELLYTILSTPHVHALPERTQAAYLQAALKLFGSWAASLSTQWTDRDAVDILRLVDETRSKLDAFAASEHIEVQERAANMLQLFAFVKADVSSHQSKKSAVVDKDADSPTPSAEPEYPKSLFLIQPLHARPLHPLPAKRTKPTVVPIPEGLDLDAWVVPPPRSAREDVVTVDEDGAPVVKKKKGKEKANGEGKVKTKSGKSKKARTDIVDSPGGSSIPASAEEVAARARRKAELDDERRHDPFYLVDKRPGPTPRPTHEEDVDSIPVVKLDLGDISSATAPAQPRPITTPALRSLHPKHSYTSVRSGPSTPIIASTPRETSTPSSTAPSSILSSSILSSSIIAAAKKATTPLSGGFAPYDGADADDDAGERIPESERPVGVSTPEPIKVTKVKKKKSAKSKAVATPT